MVRDVREIEINRISPSLRAVYTIECIEETARSIRCFGQLEPFLIWFECESFRILDGAVCFEQCQDQPCLYRDTLERWARYEATGRTVSHEDVDAWLKRWGTDREGKCPAL